MNLQTLPSSGNSVTPGNDNFALLDWSTVFGRDPTGTSGLTWAYYGTPSGGGVTGKWGGNTVAAGSFTLADDTTTYIVANRSTGAPSQATNTTNWDNTGTYARVYKITTASGAVTGYEDHRAGPFGVLSGANGTTAGKHSIPVTASAMAPSVSGGCAPLALIASAANQPDIVSLDFDATTQEYAQFSIPMPKSWNEGTVTFKPIWSHPATATNFGVVWDLQAVAISNDDPIAVAFGTAQTSTDTGGTTNDLYVGPESSAITIAGTPAAEDVVHFRISRVTGDGGDTMAVDARLHGIILYITTDAENDA